MDPDLLAFPRPFSEAKPGNYQFMALLDVNHDYAYALMGPGHLFGPLVRRENVHPDTAGVINLRISRQAPDSPVRDTATRKLVKMNSGLLSRFRGKPVEMRAGVILPRSYAKSPARRYPTVFVVHGYSSSHLAVWTNHDANWGTDVETMVTEMNAGKWPEMIYVYLDARCPLGHCVFADSENNGPCGRALTEEFIPYLEKKFRMEAVPKSRLLTGHSSGGWAALWLQVTYPDFFGGAWSTSPDPVDFRNWTGPDLTKLPAENFYYKADGSPRWLMRGDDGQDIIKAKDYASWERVLGGQGGQLASFDAVFSPRGADGRPMQMFDRDTGAIDPAVEKAWQKFDISEILTKDWERLGPKLKGKLRITVGTKDTVHLEESVYLLRDRLKQLGGEATFNFVENRTHFNLYEGGLAKRMAMEMYSVAHSGK